MNIVSMALCILWCVPAIARQLPEQDTAVLMRQVPDKMLRESDARSVRITQKLQRQTQRSLRRMQVEEQRLLQKLYATDSILSKQLMEEGKAFYISAYHLTGEADTYRSVYHGTLDSLRTGLSFLHSYANGPLQQKLLTSTGYMQQVQQQLNVTEQTHQLLQQRQEWLTQQLRQLPIIQPLKRYTQQLQEYRQTVTQYKNLLSTPDKWQRKLLQQLAQTPAFTQFFKQHSQLAGLFALPGDEPATAVAEGLQTRQMVNQLVTERGGPDLQSLVTQQNLPPVQERLQQAGQTLAAATTGSYGNSKAPLPGMRQQMRFGLNIQTQRARYYFPVTTDIALHAGYAWAKHIVSGIGLSAKLGWGTGWNNIQLTWQGIGLRTFTDVQVKGSWWLTAGFEWNQRPLPDSLTGVHDKGFSQWQPSGLMGVSKIISLKSRLWKRARVQLLWDYLSYTQRPQTAALLWRIEYAF